MRKLIAVFVLVTACHSAGSTNRGMGPASNGNQTGGADPVSALRGFLAAAKAQDIQGIGMFWGDADGSARGRYSRRGEA